MVLFNPKYSHLVTETIKEKVPVFEKANVDEFYADLSGLDKFRGGYKYASELRQNLIKNTGLPIHLDSRSIKSFPKLLLEKQNPIIN